MYVQIGDVGIGQELLDPGMKAIGVVGRDAEPISFAVVEPVLEQRDKEAGLAEGHVRQRNAAIAQALMGELAAQRMDLFGPNGVNFRRRTDRAGAPDVGALVCRLDETADGDQPGPVGARLQMRGEAEELANEIGVEPIADIVDAREIMQRDRCRVAAYWRLTRLHCATLSTFVDCSR